MKLLSPAISKLVRLRFSTIQEWMYDPFTAQREILQDLVTHGQHTAFGRKYRFEKLFSIKAFKQHIPIVEYDDIKCWIKNLMNGEQCQLWDSPVYWFAKSSGTTNDKSKFIPVTEESLQDCHYQSAKDVLTLYYNNQWGSNLLTGKGLVIGGSHQISQFNEDVFFGDLSAVLMQNMPAWGHLIRTPELSVALLDEWERKIETLAQSTIHENVTSISGVPTWTQILIKRILEITGKAKLKDVWPNLELYMHGGVSFLPYRENFKNLIGEGVNYMEMYNASEGFFAAQDNLNNDGLLLFLNHGIFYEFMPVSEYGKTNPETVGLKQVNTSEQYALVISTNGGLWRYLVGDTIQFTSLLPFRIKVTGRLKHFINAFGEEIIVNNTDAAIAAASEKTGSVVNDYTAAPVYFSQQNNGAHEWLIEFEKEPSSINEFTYELDNCLKNINSDYEAKRHKNIALRMPVVKSLHKGIFNLWLKQNGKLGGQHKIPRLSNDRNFINELLKLQLIE